MRKLLAILATAVVASTVLAACGGGDDPTAAGDRADRPPVERPTRTDDRSPSDLDAPAGTDLRACDLLTEADVTEAFGEAVVAGPQSTDECWWSTANDLKTVNLIRRTGDVATWQDGYDNDFWVPNEYGDEGYTGTALDSIVWRVGETQYEVNVVFSTRGDPDAVVRALAASAAARVGA